MSNEIKVGVRVVTPITDGEGETKHVIGELVVLNARMAHIKLDDGQIIKVGRTKIELFTPQVESKPKKPKSDRLIDSGKYNYEATKSAAGRRSKDNGDSIAILLRGKTLEEVYEIAATQLMEPIKTLMIEYGHLNPGQQRMCLGNRLRKVAK